MHPTATVAWFARMFAFGFKKAPLPAEAAEFCSSSTHGAKGNCKVQRHRLASFGILASKSIIMPLEYVDRPAGEDCG